MPKSHVRVPRLSLFCLSFSFLSIHTQQMMADTIGSLQFINLIQIVPIWDLVMLSARCFKYLESELNSERLIPLSLSFKNNFKYKQNAISNLWICYVLILTKDLFFICSLLPFSEINCSWRILFWLILYHLSNL